MSTTIDAPLKKARGGRRRGAGRPPTAEPISLIRLTPNLAADVQEGLATLFVVEDTPAGRRLRTIEPVMVRVLPHDLAHAVQAAESKAKAKAGQLQEDFANASR